MNGRKARLARRMFKSIQDVARFPDEIRHINTRQKTVPYVGINPTTGLRENAAFVFITSTQVNPARIFYRSIKRDLKTSRR
jgi:hypothetical protein